MGFSFRKHLNPFHHIKSVHHAVKKAGHQIDDGVHKAGHQIDDGVHKAGSFIDDYAHEELSAAYKAERLSIDMWEADNPWQALTAGTAQRLKPAWAEAANQNGMMSDGALKATNDTHIIAGAIAGATLATIFGTPAAGAGAWIGMTSAMGANAIAQKRATGHIDWGGVGQAGIGGAALGAVGGQLGGIAGQTGQSLAGFAGAGATSSVVQFGVGAGAAGLSTYGETGDAKMALMAGLGGGLGGAAMGGLGGGFFPSAGFIAGATLGAMGGGMMGGGGGGDIGGGGVYGGGGIPQPNNSGTGVAGTKNQSKATKSVPEAEFLDAGGGNWGNGGVGGVFGGLDRLSSSDKYVDQNKIKNQYARRATGAFVK